MGKIKSPLPLRFSIAVLVTVPVILFTLFLHHVVHFTLNIAPLAIGALIISTWVGGFWQGMLSALLLYLAVDYYFETPPNPPHRLDFRNADLVRFMVMSVFVLLTNWRRRAQTKLQQRSQQQIAVANLGQKALAGADLQSLLTEAAAIVAEHLSVDYSIVCELNGDALRVKAGVGWKEKLIGQTVISANIMSRFPAPAVVFNHTKAPDFRYELPVNDHKIGSSLSVIIDSKDSPFGVLSALTKKTRKFTADDIAYLQAIANVLAEAISRKRSEEEREKLLKSEQAARIQAEEASRLKDEFLATVSHELRTPLNHMLGWVTMLREGRLKPEMSKEALATIERNIRAQNRLVEDLLDVSRIIAGQMQLNIQQVDLTQIVEAAILSIRPAAEAKDVRLKVVMEKPQGTFSGDPDRLQQVVWNLASNAIKFTPKGGHITVRLGRTDSQIEITVSDTGEGIAPEYLPYVFDRFSQADGSFSRRHNGLGLGLAIVRHLIELHGGTVRVESSGLGQGSSFTVVLPLKTEHSLVVKQLERGDLDFNSLNMDGAPRLDGIRLLIVDDETEALTLMMTILTTQGAEVMTAGGLTEALAVLEKWRPDILLTDIEMPNGDGYDLIKKIRQIDEAEGRWLPVVAMTAYARAEDRVRALTAGFQTYITKPVKPEELLVVIANLMNDRHR